MVITAKLNQTICNNRKLFEITDYIVEQVFVSCSIVEEKFCYGDCKHVRKINKIDIKSKSFDPSFTQNIEFFLHARWIAKKLEK